MTGSSHRCGRPWTSQSLLAYSCSIPPKLSPDPDRLLDLEDLLLAGVLLLDMERLLLEPDLFRGRHL